MAELSATVNQTALHYAAPIAAPAGLKKVEGERMRNLLRIVVGVTLGVLAAGANAAPPEMRCRLGGAYIKVYGKNAEEEKEVCTRQGGEYTRYVQQVTPGKGQGREVPKRPHIWR